MPHARTASPAALSRVGLQAFFNLARVWKMDVAEQRAALGSISKQTLYNWRDNPGKVRLTGDQLDRISYLLGIYKALHVLFTRPEQADSWIRRPNDAPPFAMERVRAAVGKPIASLFELPKNAGSKTKTEILFIERCLALLRPGGRLGIVLPEGIFNNPSLAYVREFCENRAFIRAVVSLPQETFLSSGASVKASLLFLQKFTAREQADFDKKHAGARKDN